ncbi:AfsR/SARP family transcriptional regulator [Paractinoplanes durhamensis]|uniref:SARP family transcriptional regulator n=1 Tax=Paractinoplanes durhamensis TaxID=113563 RepID=A0ABQ3YYV9_9ACTN|nr:BTAD domain-containing putative transcriptional regulator [Actinoplanes durhamensis]GIE02747.1 SARP family transcriptional regulator [Actinoplanes durhamensis]
MDADVRFELLGPFRARRGDRVLPLGSAQRQAVLATLLLRPGRPFGRDALIRAVWGEDSPAYAVNQLQKHMSALRRALTPDRVLTWTDHGYVLTVPPGARDLDEFEQAVARARETGDPAAYRAALALWRGPFCAGLPGPLLAAERRRLDEQRLAVEADRCAAELDRPGRADVTGDLRRLVAEHPADERLCGLLMLALHRTGHRPAALAEFRRIDRLLREEYGVEPAAALQTLHRRVLDADPALESPAAAPVAPMQLPSGLPGFVDRESELDRLDALTDGRDPATVAVLSGTAGVGKTSLAVHWAHQARPGFPDGQLYADLRGFDPDGVPADPAEVLRGFLAALSVTAVPPGLAAQTALYRSLLAGRRMLVLLDNARSSEQVRPLLPGTPGCLTVVTSRNELTGLAVAEGARPITLERPGYAAARLLLRARLGDDRVAAEPAAVTALIGACARLPLALAVVAARAVARPGISLGTVAEQVLDGPAEDRSTDVRAAFDWSYQQLTRPGARLFRLLGPHPGPGFGVAAAASAAGLPVPAVRRLLAELAGAHLIREQPDGRYEVHDLLRSYAISRHLHDDPDEDRRAATTRLLDHYLHSAHGADVLLKPHRDDRLPLAAALAGVTPASFAGRPDAAAWLTAELPVLIALVRRTAELGRPVVRLAWTMVSFLDYAGYWQEKVDVLDAALAAAQRLDDPELCAETHRMLGSAQVRLGRFRAAHVHLDQALALCAGPGGRARVHRTAAWVLERQGRHAEALDRARCALADHHAAGNRVGEGRALNALGWFHARLGDHRRALVRCAAAVDRQRLLGDRFGEAETLDSLGFIYRNLGEYAAAAVHYRWAAGLYRDFGDRFNEADTLVSLGDTYRDDGAIGTAREAWRTALEIFEILEHPDAGGVRVRLRTAP